MKDRESPAVVLSIAGFDPSGGAGTIADVKTIASFGCRPLAAITSLTFQNAESVFGATHETAASLRAQILPIIQEQSLAAIKVGMLPTAGIVREVAELIRERDLPAPVVDPVLQSSSGYRLMEEDAIEVLVEELFPLARLLTPNIPEAERLTGRTITNEAEMLEAAMQLREMGARAVLIKGGHLQQSDEATQAIDVFDDDGQVAVFRGEWIEERSVRGTGCMLSAAIAACLGQGINLDESVRIAKNFVADAIRNGS